MREMQENMGLQEQCSQDAGAGNSAAGTKFRNAPFFSSLFALVSF